MSRFSFLALAAALLAADPDLARAGSCTPNLMVQSVSTTPALTGQLAFEGTVGTAVHVFYFDFAATAGVQRLESNFVSSYNPSFSPDGKWIVFFGQPNNQCGPYRTSNTLFVYNIGMKLLSTLIPCDANSYQDVRFSPNQQYIVFKRATSPTSRNIVYAPITLNTSAGTASLGAICNITNDSTQHSAPSVSGSGKYVYYYNSPNPSGTPIGIYRSYFNSACTAPSTSQPVTATTNSAYYPVARDQTLVFFARTSANASSNVDQIFSIAPDTDQSGVENQLNLNDCYENNNDPALVDENYIIFSRGTSDEKLFIGDVASAAVWNLKATNQSAHALGASNLRGANYSANR